MRASKPITTAAWAPFTPRFQVVADRLARHAHRLGHLALPSCAIQDFAYLTYFQGREIAIDSYMPRPNNACIVL